MQSSSNRWLGFNTVGGQGWRFEYLWVGLQPPCSGYAHTFSSNTSTAYTQGEDDAAGALIALEDYDVGVDGTPVVYDQEGNSGGCQAATDAFIQGWINFFSYPTGPGTVYGSVCGSNLSALAGLSPPPDFIWGADPDYNSNPSDLWYPQYNCGVPSGYWTNNQESSSPPVVVKLGIVRPSTTSMLTAWTRSPHPKAPPRHLEPATTHERAKTDSCSARFSTSHCVSHDIMPGTLIRPVSDTKRLPPGGFAHAEHSGHSIPGQANSSAAAADPVSDRLFGHLSPSDRVASRAV